VILGSQGPCRSIPAVGQLLADDQPLNPVLRKVKLFRLRVVGTCAKDLTVTKFNAIVIYAGRSQEQPIEFRPLARTNFLVS
jgi:hypothetical protein